ncbi:hypothetical protein MTO96_035854, partial [Rhipicephalus appendiculatus]
MNAFIAACRVHNGGPETTDTPCSSGAVRTRRRNCGLSRPVGSSSGAGTVMKAVAMETVDDTVTTEDQLVPLQVFVPDLVIQNYTSGSSNHIRPRPLSKSQDSRFCFAVSHPDFRARFECSQRSSPMTTVEVPTLPLSGGRIMASELPQVHRLRQKAGGTDRHRCALVLDEVPERCPEEFFRDCRCLLTASRLLAGAAE